MEALSKRVHPGAVRKKLSEHKLMQTNETIICWKCEKPKHPCLFTPHDVKQARTREDGKRVSTCRSCRNSYKPKTHIRRGQGMARLSLKSAFEKALVQGRAG